MENGINLSLNEQLIILERILNKNIKLMSILKILEKDGIKNYYVGAGCINQTVFNLLGFNSPGLCPE